jgi:hypothetical protein
VAITLTQTATPVNGGGASSSSPTISYGVNVTNGNLLLVAISTAGAGTTVNSVTGSRATYTRRAGRVFLSGTGGTEIWAGIATSSGAETITANFSSSVTYCLFAEEWNASAGWQSSSDGNNSGTGTSTTPATGNIVTAQANDGIYGIEAAGNNPTQSAGTGYGNLQGPITNGSTGVVTENRFNLAAGTYTATWTLGTSQAWNCCAAAFAEVGGHLFLPPNYTLGAGGPFFVNPVT